MEVEVRKSGTEAFERDGAADWPIWTCDVSTFDWDYEDRETCYVLEGEAVVRTEDGAEVRFGAGDRVVFPKGLACTWEVIRPVRKHYRFG
jgi:hypothetical protein